MEAEERRSMIMEKLMAADKPISASSLADTFSVSRQIIVGDIALLRAAGADISATPRGYIRSGTVEGIVHSLACKHTKKQTRDELYAIVDEGCTVVNVIVEHPVYGQLTGLLHLSSRHDVNEYISKSDSKDVRMLSSLTDGIHMHEISCPDEASFERVRNALGRLGVLLQ